MSRKDKKPEIPPPSPSSSYATTSSSDATSTDSPPPNATTIPTTPNSATPSAQHDTASSSSAASDSSESDSDSPPPPKQPQPVSAPGGSGSGPEKKKPKKIVISALPTTNVDKRATDSAGGTAVVTTTPHKQLFQRIWSDEDEIVILKGMIDYKASKGADPMSNVDDFLDFIKKSLKVADANKAQVVNKVKRLKTKFQNAKKKKTLTNPHEIETFRLSKLIWGDDVEAEKEKEEGKVEKDEVIRKWEDVGDGDGKGGDVVFGFSGEDEVMLKEAMRAMEGSERRELKKKVRSASLGFVEAYLMRLKVMQVAAQKVLDDLKES